MPETSIVRLKELARGTGTDGAFIGTVATQGVALTAPQIFNLMEVIMLSDKSIGLKMELLHWVGDCIAGKAAPYRHYTPGNEQRRKDYLQVMSQNQELSSVCLGLQDALKKISPEESDSTKRHHVAELQDSLRHLYELQGIPVEDRQGYTDLGIPGRNFLAGTMAN